MFAHLKLLFRYVATVTALTAAAFVTVSCSSTTNVGRPGSGPAGEYLMQGTGPIEVLLSYKFAAQNPGEEWLLLEAMMTGSLRRATEVAREDIFVQTPTGEKIPLPTQKELSAEYSDIRALVRRFEIATQPLDVFSRDRRRCRLPFLVVPGKGTTADKTWLSDREVCVGPLFFPVPGGVQPGRWVLGIDFEEARMRIPFVIPEST
jgi:hypothetical protein